jgi:3-isopropylmalate/(R)-2-methylmalate dehydratase small subunit
MNDSESLIAEGRVWLFADDNINTDLMMPQSVFAKSIEEQMRNVFATYRPGWVEQVRPGDILVGGRNFGTGSSRPGSMLLKRLGIAALVAESINGLFYRNCINYALPAMECAGIRDFLSEGEVARVDVGEGIVENLARRSRLAGAKMPEFLQAIVRAGGIMERLRSEGYL